MICSFKNISPSAWRRTDCRRQIAAGGQGGGLWQQDLAGGPRDKGKLLDSRSALQAKLRDGHRAEGGGRGVPYDTQMSGSAQWDQ